MYRKKSKITGTIDVNDAVIGERLEVKLERITTNKEPIEATAEIIFTERKDGVLPGYNIRTDRFEVALEAMDKINRSRTAKRDFKPTVAEKEVTKSESIQGDELPDSVA